MGNAAPTVGTSMFVDLNVTSTKTVTVRVPSGATGYDETWKTAFKGGSAPPRQFGDTVLLRTDDLNRF
jgi:hypothetical protein